jgi:hypothetical protein
MAFPSLVSRLFPSRLLGPAALQLAQRSRKEILQQSEGFSAASAPELRGYIRARAMPVLRRLIQQFLASEGAALRPFREILLRQTLEVATEQTMVELRQAQRQSARRWKAA